jgi:hypothetical protein
MAATRLHSAFEIGRWFLCDQDLPIREQGYLKRESLHKDMRVVVQGRTGGIYNKRKGCYLRLIAGTDETAILTGKLTLLSIQKY